MTEPRLPRRTVLRHLERLADDLVPRQRDRLRALADLIDDDGRIPLARALEIATPGGDEQTSQAAFRKFRSVIKEATLAAGVDLRLVTDGRKTSPQQRFCWFVGEDTAGEELAEMSARESRRITGDALVRPAVAEMLDAPPASVYVSTAAAPGARAREHERAFVALLRERLALRRDRIYRVTSSLEVDLGRDIAAERHRLREQADAVVILVSPAYLADSGGDARWVAASARRRSVLVALEGLPPGPLHAQGLPLDEIHLRTRPFSRRAAQTAKVEFVDECLVAITARLADPATVDVGAGPPATDPDCSDVPDWVYQEMTKRRPKEHLVPPRASETNLSEHLAATVGELERVRNLGQPVPAVERLTTWATDFSDGTTHLCALLGDVGMGKTTTTKLFTEELLRRREGDPQAPLPILFDLRELTLAALRDGPNLRRILEALLHAGSVHERRPNVDDVLGLIARGNCVLIFDGLDEVLVHLSPHDGQVFTRTLWRATEDSWQAARPGGNGKGADRRPDRPSKLLLSCRTHYFRSIREETTHFTGQHRDGPAARDYLALLMVPFDEAQIREYLQANVPHTDVDNLLDLIDSVHNLREIAHRPLTLHLITQQLELIERAKFDGRTVHAVDLYASFVEQWLARDEGKHSLLPEHKLLLMEHLAAELWRSRRTAWTTQDVEQWLLEFMAARPDLELHYAARAPDLWKEDLRTATFLIRRDDDRFAFAHTSLREYFLSRYLLRALELGAERLETVERSWQLPVPSPETLAFLGQHLAGLGAARRQTCLDTLTALAVARSMARSPGSPSAAVLAFGYGLAAAGGGYPHHPLTGSRLDNADLRGWRIEAPGDTRLDLHGTSFAGADLTEAVLRGVDLRDANLTGADLTRAEVHDSDLGAADLRDARLIGTILRGCAVHGARWTGSTAHRAQRLHCQPADEPALPGWLYAPTEQASPPDARLASLTGHTDWVSGGGFSPDGTRILTTSDDRTARVWDAATGTALLTLTGHTLDVTGGGFSPDGTRILTTSGDRTARVWDAPTGTALLTLTGHTSWVSGGGFSLDGTRILTTSGDRTARVWDAATGTALLTVTGHTSWVSGGGFSPDGTRILTTSDDRTARVWDAATGTALLTLTGHTSWVSGGGFSPDGTRILTTSDDRTARVWDVATGATLLTLTGHIDLVTGGGFSLDGTRILTTSDDRTARVWDAATGATLLTVTGHTSWVSGGGFSPDGTRILTTSGDHTARVWDAATGATLLTLTGHTLDVTGGGFSPDGTRILTTSNDQTARIWDAGTGTALLTLTGHIDLVSGGGFSPDGTRILTTSGDHTARVWDAATGATLLTLTGHTRWVSSGGFSPDGTRIQTTSYDRTARIWDAATGEQTGWQLEQLPDGQVAVWSVPEHRLLGASPEAWRWLGWLVRVDGVVNHLPAETYGALPLLECEQS